MLFPACFPAIAAHIFVFVGKPRNQTTLRTILFMTSTLMIIYEPCMFFAKNIITILSLQMYAIVQFYSYLFF